MRHAPLLKTTSAALSALWLSACPASDDGAVAPGLDATADAHADVVAPGAPEDAPANDVPTPADTINPDDAAAAAETAEDAGSTPADAAVDSGSPPEGTWRPQEPRHNTLIGRPTDSGFAVSVMALAAGDAIRVEHGTRLTADGAAIADAALTGFVTSQDGAPMVAELTGLPSNTRVYYRVHYRTAGEAGEGTPDVIHAAWTQRARGATFRFTVQGDTHPERWNDKMFHPELFALTLREIRARLPDLHFTLGDDFSLEKILADFKRANFPSGHSFSRAVEGRMPHADYLRLPKPFARAMIVDGVGAPQGYAAYREVREDFFGIIGPFTALMLTNGNHEQAHLAHLGGIFNNAAIWAAEGRLKYYPSPAADGFYGSASRQLAPVNGYPTLEAPDALPRESWAFTWGDALFVTLDPYWHSEHASPDSTPWDDPEDDDWAPTLGDTQYQWLKRTLEGSSARWKFVFAHHVNGNNRGGAALVGRQEWGGARGFAENRPTWPKPIHQLFVDTGVTIFFQGHDHLFAREIVDGVVYQTVPNPADNSYFAYNCDAFAPASVSWSGPAGYGRYDASYSVRLPNTGFLDVEVGPDAVRVDYVRTYREADLAANLNGAFRGTERSGEVAFTYHRPPAPGDTDPTAVSFTCQGASPPAGWGYAP